MVGIKQNLALLVAAGVYWILALLNPGGLYGNAGETIFFVQHLAWLAFVIIHGGRRYGWDNLFVFFGITFVISWSTEAASVASGFPFGHYHYTDLLGVKLGPVPLIIMPSYFAAGYVAWTMSTILLGNLGRGITKRNLVLVPLVASLVMVIWDLCYDPINSTIQGAWIWEEGGAHFGVPISNYFGWFLTAYLIFQVFALTLFWFSSNERLGQDRVYWVLAPVMYLGLALGCLLGPFTQTEHLQIYWAQSVIAVGTMVPVSVLTIIFVLRLDRDSL